MLAAPIRDDAVTPAGSLERVPLAGAAHGAAHVARRARGS